MSILRDEKRTELDVVREITEAAASQPGSCPGVVSPPRAEWTTEEVMKNISEVLPFDGPPDEP